MLEKMFGFKKPEKKDKKSSSEKKSFLERIKDNRGLKIMALVLSLLAATETMQAGNDGNKENIKNKTEDARLLLNKISEHNKKINDEQKGFETHNIDGLDVKSYNYANGDEMMVADDSTFILFSSGNKKFYDLNADGTIDRVIVDKQETSVFGDEIPKNEKFLTDYMYSSKSMVSLAEEAETTSQMNPKKVLVANINGDKVEMVNLEDGSAGYVDGSQAEEMKEKMQSSYNKELEELANSIEK